jgi:hypothetical protein
VAPDEERATPTPKRPARVVPAECPGKRKVPSPSTSPDPGLSVLLVIAVIEGMDDDDSDGRSVSLDSES